MSALKLTQGNFKNTLTGKAKEVVQRSESERRIHPIGLTHGVKNYNPNKPIGPQVYVRKYLDFSQQYGLGFILNNNVIGVHFNDNTKIVESTEDGLFIYVTSVSNEHGCYEELMALTYHEL